VGIARHHCHATSKCKFLLYAHADEGVSKRFDRGERREKMQLAEVKQACEYVEYGNICDSQGLYEKALDAYEPKLGYVAPAGEMIWVGSGLYLAEMARNDTGPDTVSEMVGLVERAAAYGHAEGEARAFAEISNRSGAFIDGDGHYIYAYDYNGTLLAHPYLPEKVGTSLLERTDQFGMKTIRALVETARSGGGYIVFVWPNPDKGNRDELKIGYVLPVNETWWVGSGAYLSEITGTDAPLSPAP
jgi:signal transduction histidine kinase